MTDTNNADLPLVVILLAICMLMANACDGQSISTTAQFASSNSTHDNLSDSEASGVLHSSYVTSRSFQELAAKSSLVVIGELEQTTEVINLARNIDDISSADPAILNLGQVYRLTISTNLRGKSESTILGCVDTF